MYIATAKIENYKVPANTTLFANNSRCSDTEVYETFYLDWEYYIRIYYNYKL